MKMVNTPNWTDKEHEWLLDNINRKSIEEIAAVLGRTPRAVRLYCYRHYIPVRPTVKKSMVQQLLDIKFGDSSAMSVEAVTSFRIRISHSMVPTVTSTSSTSVHGTPTSSGRRLIRTTSCALLIPTLWCRSLTSIMC